MGLALRIGVLASYGLLLALLLAWPLGLLGNGGATPGYLVFALPLALLLPGLWRGSGRSHLIAAMVSLLYLLHGIVILLDPAPGMRLLGGIESLLSVALLTAASLFVRIAPRP